MPADVIYLQLFREPGQAILRFGRQVHPLMINERRYRHSKIQDCFFRGPSSHKAIPSFATAEGDGVARAACQTVG